MSNSESGIARTKFPHPHEPWRWHQTGLALPSLHALCEGAQIGRGYFHLHIVSGLRVEDTLLHDVRLERALRGAQRVATAVTRRALFAGHGTHTCHRAGRLYTGAGMPSIRLWTSNLGKTDILSRLVPDKESYSSSWPSSGTNRRARPLMQ